MNRGSAPGKIILSGEYAVVFGYAGIAVPARVGVEAVFVEDGESTGVEIDTGVENGNERLTDYIKNIVALCSEERSLQGKLTVTIGVPIGKGMGSSTAIVVAVTRALCGEDFRNVALRIEDELNPGHSGLDFEAIWGGVPVMFRKGEVAQPISLPLYELQNALLIDTGVPTEATPELVEWMKSRENTISGALKKIDECTERLMKGESLISVMRDHHAAQVVLGVVPLDVQSFVYEIERNGGAAKVIGAGGKTGGGGMVLAIGDLTTINDLAAGMGYGVVEMNL